MKTVWTGAAFAAFACSVTSVASAGTLDLTVNPSGGFINGAFFGTFDSRPAGTGFIDSFVRIRRNGTEEGYNTTVPMNNDLPFDELFGNFTRDITLGDIPTVLFNGVLYKQFVLDINEPNGEPMNLLSLDAVQIYMGPGGQNTTNVASLGTLVYNMDMGDPTNDVLLDYNNFTGSGQFDMEMLVPLANFAGFNDSDNLILYSHFGSNPISGAASGDGFEEWAVLLAQAPVIPLPSAAGMGLIGLAGLATIRRRRN